VKIFLTGATGYIGSQLAKRLLLEGHELAIVIRPKSNLKVLHKLLPQIEVHIYDGSYASLFAALNTSKPDLVFHIASLFIAQHKQEDVPSLIESNIIFPVQLLEAMNQLEIKQLINTGTSWQHFNNEDYNPVNLYAATKQAFESLLAFYVESQGLKAITLKLFDTYGPGDFRPKLFSLLRKATHTGETLSMSPGQQLLDLVYIDDVLEAYKLAIEQLSVIQKSESYAVSSLTTISLRDLLKIYSETTERKVNVEWGGQPYRAREVFIPWTNFNLLPGWVSQVSLAQGIYLMEENTQIGGLLS
jgi:nucleoside-diphosphate-sugar epimerase